MFEVTHRYLAVCFPVCVLRYSSSLIQARLSLITPNLALKIRAKQHVSFVSITLSPQKENPLQLRQIIQFLFVGTFFAKLFFFLLAIFFRAVFCCSVSTETLQLWIWLYLPFVNQTLRYVSYLWVIFNNLSSPFESAVGTDKVFWYGGK